MKPLRDTLGRLLGRRDPKLQVGAVCVDDGGQVLLISSRDTGRWIIPKGWPMPGSTLAEAALQEAWEEAGVVGTISDRPLGSYGYQKTQDRGFAIPVEVQVFVARVERLADDFPEQRERTRRWFTPAQAAGLVHEPDLARLLRGLGR